ncbi:type II secretion system protein GspM [Methylocapsa sp. S129]|uniref:type II secretion system protein GspM n=1 Tax=Methylocapsa sp. S129 TaxID=1641869 RepID=UPI00131BD160|nr:type II secretion system protein GspM [Methylocapsa sp. S129]
MSEPPIRRTNLTRRQASAALAYAAVVACLIVLALWPLSSLADRASAVSTQAEMLDRLDSRKKPADGSGELGATGSPFLDGQSVTIAGATLQQRIGGAVMKAGGNVLSSQIELDGPESKEGFVRLTTNFEIAQPAVQQVLYDLEAGMPFLFVDVLSVQAPQAVGETETERVRASMGVYGQWLPAK